MRAAAAITDIGVEAAYAVIAPGIRDGDVAAAITAANYTARAAKRSAGARSWRAATGQG